MDKERLIELAHRFGTGEATEQEQNELHQWYDSMEDTGEPALVITQHSETPDAVGERMLTKMLDQIREEEKEQKPTAVIPIWKRYKLNLLAAAAVVTAVVGTVYFTLKPEQHRDIVIEEKKFKNDIAPGGNHATLTLADGRQLLLDSMANGELARQGNTQITKSAQGELAYNATGESAEMLYNTVATPVGGQYQLTLPDGSKVWLNAKSSIRFPAAFKGPVRQVELTGEAYFEVAKKTGSKFSVDVRANAAGEPACAVEVLGTHFNIKAYAGEPEVKTTLLEGSVRVAAPGVAQAQILAPGQQAQVGQTGNIRVLKNVDMDEAVAWKNGLFMFRGMSLQEVMQQAIRWYGIDVVYEGNIQEHFVSTIPRQSTAIEFLTILEKTGRVQFKIDGKKVTVMPAK